MLKRRKLGIFIICFLTFMLSIAFLLNLTNALPVAWRRWLAPLDTVVCRVGEKTITLKDANQMLNYFLVANSISLNEDEIKSHYFYAFNRLEENSFIAEKAVEMKLKPLSGEELKAVNDRSERFYGEFMRGFRKAGISKEYVLQQFTIDWESQLLAIKMFPDITVTDAEVKDEYDKLMREQIKEFEGVPRVLRAPVLDSKEGAIGYENRIMQALRYDALLDYGTYLSLVVYRPEGYRMVRQILIPFTNDVAKSIYQASEEYDTSKIQELMNKNLPAIKARAEEVLAKAQAGEDFEKLLSSSIAKYYPGVMELMDNEPPVEPPSSVKYTNFMFTEYAVGPTSVLDGDFVKAVHGFAKIGDMTGLIATKHGYHIIQWIGNVPSGPIPYEDVQDAIKESLLRDKKRAAWNTALEQWKAETKIERYLDKIPY